MKKIISIMIAFMLVFSMSITPKTAYADVIPMLPGDFYSDNYEDLAYINRNFIVDSASGEITVYESPEQLTKAGSLQNGEEIVILYTYLQGEEVWGGNYDGWVLMGNLSLVYDSEQFQVDNASEITEYAGDDYSIPTVMLYEYPNSGDPSEYKESLDYSMMTKSVSSVYTDEDDKTWGLITYYMGMRGYWICLSDPTNDSFNGGIMENIPSQTSVNGEDFLPENASAWTIGESGISIFAVVLVLAVVVLSAIIIIKKRK